MMSKKYRLCPALQLKTPWWGKNILKGSKWAFRGGKYTKI